MCVLMHFERNGGVTSWRVFWVPQDAVRDGVRRLLLAGWGTWRPVRTRWGCGREIDLPAPGVRGRPTTEPVWTVDAFPWVHDRNTAELRNGHQPAPNLPLAARARMDRSDIAGP